MQAIPQRRSRPRDRIVELPLARPNRIRTPSDLDRRCYAGQQLKLVEGVAEITFKTGARMLLQAPAELDVAAAVSVLHHGRLTATCPPGAEGFRVDTQGLVLN